MNEWSDAEISRRLALAIGWTENEVRCVDGIYTEVLWSEPWFVTKMWKQLDYRAPAVIWPIADRFAAFPMKSASGNGWVAITDDLWHSGSGHDFVIADTAAKAVALAVIKAKEQT